GESSCLSKYWIPAFAGMNGDCCTFARLSYSLVKQPTLRRPDFWGAGTACSLVSRPPRKENRGRAGRLGPDGPTGLDASRHRGLSKSLLVPQVRQIPRRPARGV